PGRLIRFDWSRDREGAAAPLRSRLQFAHRDEGTMRTAALILAVLALAVAAYLSAKSRDSVPVPEHFPAPDAEAKADTPTPGTTEVATFASGWFWCTEAVFLQMKGVTRVVSGYAGGNTPNPTYAEVCA